MPDNTLTYRLAEKEDCALYYEWANDEGVRQNSFSPSKIEWETHCIWFAEKLSSGSCLLLVFFNGLEPVGQLRLDIMERNIAEIDYSIDKNWRGKKIGPKILSTSRRLLDILRPELVLKGIVKTSNVPSINTFNAAGFLVKETIQMKGEECLIYYSR